MKLHKRIFNQAWAQSLVSLLIALYLRVVRLTGRWETRGEDDVQRLMDAGQPLIFCFWHGRLISNIFCWRNEAVLHILSTPHRDGQIAARSYNRFGIQTIWGSTKKGGTGAVREILKVLKDGGVIGITPDGPKGPRQRMQKSAIDMARMTGAMLVPVSNATTRCKWLGTWDRMVLPLPFGRGVFAFGEAMEIPRKASDEEFERIRAAFEDRLNALTRQLDAECGQTTPDPAPLAEGREDGA
ncbi:MAG: lysophospholipid acyltransferase family protein [Alphaproteobacteria bacterium]|nr:lysophospholipid acyltransferase family protein [Alphaproteobacteria bacterium]